MPGFDRPHRILVLAGTADARRLCAQLANWPKVAALAALAGATAQPLDYPCPVRRGGFGGSDGLASYLRAERFAALIDATHPFAEVISQNAARAAAAASTPILRLCRPPWTPPPTARWSEFPNLEAAATAIPAGARAFLAVGRRSLGPFCDRTDYWRAARVIDPPEAPPPFSPGRWVVGRPPFSAAHESAMLSDLEISHLVAKNAGGAEGWTKIEAAAERSVPILLIARPNAPPTPSVATVEDALTWLQERF